MPNYGRGKMNNEDIIKYMYEHQDEEFKRLNLDFKRIGNRPLQLIVAKIASYSW